MKSDAFLNASNVLKSQESATTLLQSLISTGVFWLMNVFDRFDEATK